MTNSNPTAAQQLTAHALLIGDRINTAGFEGQVLSSSPLAVRVGTNGLAVLFRYGVAVFIGLSAARRRSFSQRLSARTYGRITPAEEEWAKIQVAKEAEEPIPGRRGMPALPMRITRHRAALDPAGRAA